MVLKGCSYVAVFLYCFPVPLVRELDLTWMQVTVFLMVLAGNSLVGG